MDVITVLPLQHNQTVIEQICRSHKSETEDRHTKKRDGNERMNENKYNVRTGTFKCSRRITLYVFFSKSELHIFRRFSINLNHVNESKECMSVEH